MPYAQVLEADLAVIVVIDFQEKMLSAIGSSPAEEIVSRTCKLLSAAQILEIPVIPVLYTEQNPGGLGATNATVARHLPAGSSPIIKASCSCWRDENFREALQATDREHVILVGLETHICIQQTALDLVRVDYVPFVAGDCVGSRRATDMQMAIERMRSSAVVVSTAEALIFELVERCDHPRFKDILKLVK